MDPYSIIAQYPNAGAAFSNAFQQGMQQNALAGFAAHPDDPRAQSAAARYDPGAVMQYELQAKKEQQQLAAQQQQDWHKYAGELAKWADNPQKWDQAVDYLVQSGHPEAAQLRGHFSPALRANFMALGGVSDSANEGQPKYFNLAPGGSVVAVDPVTQQVSTLVMPNDGSQATGGSAPAPQAGGDLRAQAIDAIQRGADPAQVLQRMVQLQGGQTAQPSGGFSGPN